MGELGDLVETISTFVGLRKRCFPLLVDQLSKVVVDFRDHILRFLDSFSSDRRDVVDNTN